MRVANGTVWNISAGTQPNSTYVTLLQNPSIHYTLPASAAATMMAVATEARRSGFFVNISYDEGPSIGRQRRRRTVFEAIQIEINAALP